MIIYMCVWNVCKDEKLQSLVIFNAAPGGTMVNEDAHRVP